MNEEEELKSMILSFRVSELHMLLGFAGRNKSGRKLELQARAIELLKLKSYPVVLKIRNLYKSIQQSTNSGAVVPSIQDVESAQPDISYCDSGHSLRVEVVTETDISEGTNSVYLYRHQGINQERSDVYSSVFYRQSYTLKSTVPIHSSHYPVHPDVKFKRLPFYEVSAELLKPSTLVPQLTSRTQESTFVFHLTPQQATAIGLSRDLRSGTKADYSVQGQLRFCLLETTSEQEDCFPPGLLVKINNKLCQLPNPIPTNKPGAEPKRPPRPVNITHLMKISPTVGNTVQIQWNPDFARRYAVAIYLVHKKTSEDLLNRLKAKGVRSADYTRGMIKDKMNEDADCEIATTSLRVSLICPLGKKRMVTPCRASTCQHLQCFDASLFLQMNEKKPTWVCPVCDKPTVYDKLVIDGYFQDVLSSGKLCPESNEIQLHSDGSWSCHVVKKDQELVLCQPEAAESPVSDKDDISELIQNDDPKPEPKIETVEVDIDDDDDEQIVSQSEMDDEFPSPSKDFVSLKRKVEEIDLTLSDSDDEPLIIHKKRDCSYFEEYNNYPCDAPSPDPPESIISSGQNSPSLIIIDSDSSSSSISISQESPPRSRSPSPHLILSCEALLSPSDDGILLSCHSTTSFEHMPEL